VLHKKIGNKIRKLRTGKNMTLEQLGEVIGVTKGYVHHMENGNRKISIDFLQSMADVFNVEMYYFFTDSNLIKIDDEMIRLINAKEEWDRQDITLDDIKTWIGIANSRRK